MVHYMNENKPQYSRLRKGLMVGALTISTLAAAIFGVKYHNTSRELNGIRSELSNVQQELSNVQQQVQLYKTEQESSIDDKVRETFESVKDRVIQVIPEVKRDYKKIAVYGSTGLLIGLGVAYLVRRSRRKQKSVVR